MKQLLPTVPEYSQPKEEESVECLRHVMDAGWNAIKSK